MGGGISLNGKSILDLTYPIGSLYISKENVSPAELLGGVWEQLSADAYFKIITSENGLNEYRCGGTSSSHKIPIESMPSHYHNTGATNHYNYSTSGNNFYITSSGYPVRDVTTNGAGFTGGDQPYYPYYYGVYAWIRIS